MKWIEVVESHTGIPYLIPAAKILCIEKIDPDNAYYKRDRPNGQSIVRFGRSSHVVCKDRYEDVLRFIRDAGGVIVNRPE